MCIRDRYDVGLGRKSNRQKVSLWSCYTWSFASACLHIVWFSCFLIQQAKGGPSKELNFIVCKCVLTNLFDFGFWKNSDRLRWAFEDVKILSVSFLFRRQFHLPGIVYHASTSIIHVFHTPRTDNLFIPQFLLQLMSYRSARQGR